MAKVYIEYNPYTVETIFKINGEEVKSQEKYKSISKQKEKRLQYYLEADNKNWGGIVEEFRKIINSKNIDIEFKGRKIDYDDLEYTVLKYKDNSKVNIKLKYIKAREDNEIHEKFCEFINKVKKSPIKELQGNIIQNAIKEGMSTDFKMSVLGTMSSGKSTLINALIGNDLLPSENQACTATIARIRDDDNNNEFTVECKDKDEKIVYPKEVINFNEENDGYKITPKVIEKYNNDEKVMYIDIEGKIPEISSKKMNLVLQDTPGPNNSRNKNHKKTTDTIIEDENKGIVLYIMNVTQFGVNDDDGLLREIADAMKVGGKQSKDRFIFVLNKCDEIDEAKESLNKLIEKAKKYLKDHKIENPNIFPVSAQKAKLIRMYKQGIKLTRSEKSFLNDYEDYIEYEELHFDKLASLSQSSRSKLEEKLSEARKNNDKYEEALIHTGIPAIEVAINEYLEKYAYPIKIKKSIEQIQYFIKEQDMMNKFYNKLVENKNEYEKIKNQINDKKEKINSGNKATEIKAKIDEFSIDNFKLHEIDKKIHTEITEINDMLKGKSKVEKELAKKIISNIKFNLNKLQQNIFEELNSFIYDNVIKNGEKLLDEYDEYIENIKDELIIEGFKFEDTVAFQNIKIKDIDNLIYKYKKIEDVYEDKVYVNTDKKWYKPWTWFEPDTYTRREKVSEKEYINVEKLLTPQIIKLETITDENIDIIKKKSINDVKSLKDYFKDQIDKINKFVKCKIYELDKLTKNQDYINKKLKESEYEKKEIDDINSQLIKLLEI